MIIDVVLTMLGDDKYSNYWSPVGNLLVGITWTSTDEINYDGILSVSVRGPYWDSEKKECVKFYKYGGISSSSFVLSLDWNTDVIKKYLTQNKNNYNPDEGTYFSGDLSSDSFYEDYIFLTIYDDRDYILPGAYEAYWGRSWLTPVALQFLNYPTYSLSNIAILADSTDYYFKINNMNGEYGITGAYPSLGVKTTIEYFRNDIEIPSNERYIFNSILTKDDIEYDRNIVIPAGKIKYYPFSTLIYFKVTLEIVDVYTGIPIKNMVDNYTIVIENFAYLPREFVNELTPIIKVEESDVENGKDFLLSINTKYNANVEENLILDEYSNDSGIYIISKKGEKELIDNKIYYTSTEPGKDRIKIYVIDSRGFISNIYETTYSSGTNSYFYIDSEWKNAKMYLYTASEEWKVINNVTIYNN